MANDKPKPKLKYGPFSVIGLLKNKTAKDRVKELDQQLKQATGRKNNGK